ncbi:uncharacterized protein BJ212DRAFT_1297295 [Suillus subaureus]|uniref:Uncharacterized protein n=1 Tax=Suillus subaureus TaxID=48587 RepID=A0A9P7EIA0_9AGAM|nr:uncharacterized protein BJ212DRAFT_1297295 [Suillus subaureus]KAG1822046.1 hypothetical protein BJ212DRAFT_1297295 [Suillus subaureus]
MTLKYRPSGPQCQQVWLTVTIVILCTQLQVAEMTRKVKSVMAGTSFKEATFNEAAKYIESLRTVGPVKTGAHCKNKWAMAVIETMSAGPTLRGLLLKLYGRTQLPHEEFQKLWLAIPFQDRRNSAPPQLCMSTSSTPYSTDNSMSDVNYDGNPNDSGIGAMYQHHFIHLIPSMAWLEISWGVPPPPNPAFEDYGSSTMAAPPTMFSHTSTSALSAPTMSAPSKSLPAMFAPMSAPMPAPPMPAPMSAPPMSTPISAPTKSAPMSSGLSAGNSPFDHLHFGLTIDEAGIREEAKAVNNEWQDTPLC